MDPPVRFYKGMSHKQKHRDGAGATARAVLLRVRASTVSVRRRRGPVWGLGGTGGRAGWAEPTHGPASELGCGGWAGGQEEGRSRAVWERVSSRFCPSEAAVVHKPQLRSGDCLPAAGKRVGSPGESGDSERHRSFGVECVNLGALSSWLKRMLPHFLQLFTLREICMILLQ